MKTCNIPKVWESNKRRTNTERAVQNAGLYPPVMCVIGDLILNGIVERNQLNEQIAKVKVFQELQL